MGEANRRKLFQSTQRPFSPDAKILLLSADGFKACSRPVCEKMRPSQATAREEVRRDIGGVVASAVNLSFSIELYLKALRLEGGLPPRRHHRLDDLYADLPRELRKSIEKAYDAVEGKAGHAKVVGFGVSLNVSRSEERKAMRRAEEEPADESLGAVLRRSRNVFEAWRYLHERGEPGKIELLQYEFHCLEVAADVLRAHLVGKSAR